MNMKRNIQLLLAVGSVAGASAARADHLTSIAGLVNLTNYQAALLVITDSPPEAAFSSSTHKWVAEGQIFNDLQMDKNPSRVEISQIDFAHGVVRAKENGVNLLYVPQHTNSAWTDRPVGFHLDNASLDDVLDFYALATGRTMLMHPAVDRSSLTIATDAHGKLEAAGSIEKNLQQRGVTMIADGDKFEWVVPASLAAVLQPIAAPASPAATETSSTNSVDALPESSINFINVPLPQMLDVYQALTARKWVQDKPLPTIVPFNFRNQTPLTKAETLHVFTVLLGWRGLEIVNVDDKTFKLVPVGAGQ